MKTLTIILRIVLGLMLVMPILGAFGIFPAPTRDLYNTDIAYDFINMLIVTGFVNIMMSVVFALSLFLIITNRMALAALLLLPITLNIVAFHLVIDGGLFTGGAVMGNVMLIINFFFLWQNRAKYKSLWEKSVY